MALKKTGESVDLRSQVDAQVLEVVLQRRVENRGAAFPDPELEHAFDIATGQELGVEIDQLAVLGERQRFLVGGDAEVLRGEPELDSVDLEHVIGWEGE